ncbi:neurofilament heavy protein [Thalictrum thalictroides]|uniref:Neurofilament heavy protein n=1 Tax=Thalictrum thalictroides TaxID=46969 RepID=A0A7J6VXM6_THATH|nr:neurofilament heavy protein [Thalictrum thalictroides]
MEIMQNVFESEEKFDNEDESADEIYEKIEAPKYVDLTRPDQFLPDDPSWFCLRIGCDQNHEDVDPDALHKSFVLRVMAARSPNLRLRKALRCRQVPSAYMKYPQSAPAKPSKPRVCRFTAMTSISQKIAEVKVKVHPVSNNLTPKPRARECSALGKALTTPRAKKLIPSSDPFRSVQNPKTTDVLPKTKIVAKALVFSTPKKSERKKTLSESEIPMTEICDGLKKLEINSQRKKLSWNSSNLSKCTASCPKISRIASDESTTNLHSQKLKNRLKDSGDQKEHGSNPTRSKKKKGTKSLQKLSCPQTDSRTTSDMEFDGESRYDSLGDCSVSEVSRSNEGNECEEKLDLAVVFSTPKKSERKKISKPEIPMTEICDGMKKLELNSQRKKLSCNYSKLLNCTASHPKASRTASDPSPTKLYPQKLRSRVKDSEDQKDLGVNPKRSKKRKSTKTLQNVQLKAASILVDVQSVIVDVPNNNQVTCLSSSEKDLEKVDTSRIQNLNGTQDNELSKGDEYGKGLASKGSEDREDALTLQNSNIAGFESELLNSDDKENAAISNGNRGDEYEKGLASKGSEDREDVLVLQTSNIAGFESELLNSDDKENAAGSNGNRELNLNINNDRSERINLQNEVNENQQKVVINAQHQASKGKPTVATIGSLGGKYKKIKPTNPKPFRLRTNERGILREANLEKKHMPNPPKENKPVSRDSDESVQRRHTTNKQSVKSHGQCRQETDSREGCQIESDKRYQKTPRQQFRPTYPKTIKCAVEQKTCIISTQITRSQLLRQQLTRTQRGTGTRKKTISTASPCRLSVIKETSSMVSRTKVTKPRTKGTITAAVDSSSRSSSAGRRPVTVPKEPHFQRIHTPKSCTKTVK